MADEFGEFDEFDDTPTATQRSVTRTMANQSTGVVMSVTEVSRVENGPTRYPIRHMVPIPGMPDTSGDLIEGAGGPGARRVTIGTTPDGAVVPSRRRGGGNSGGGGAASRGIPYSDPSLGPASSPMGVRCLPDGLLNILRGVSALSREFGDYRFISQHNRRRRRSPSREQSTDSTATYATTCSSRSRSRSACEGEDGDGDEEEEEEGKEGDGAASEGGASSMHDDGLSVSDALPRRRRRTGGMGDEGEGGGCDHSVHVPDISDEEMDALSFSTPGTLYTAGHLAIARRAAGNWCAACMLTSSEEAGGGGLMKKIEDVLTTRLQEKGIVGSVRMARHLYDRVEFESGQKPRWLVWSIFFHVYEHLQGHAVVSPLLRLIEMSTLRRQIMEQGICVKYPLAEATIDPKMMSLLMNSDRLIKSLTDEVAAATGSAVVKIAGSAATSGSQKVMKRGRFQGRARGGEEEGEVEGEEVEAEAEAEAEGDTEAEPGESSRSSDRGARASSGSQREVERRGSSGKRARTARRPQDRHRDQGGARSSPSGRGGGPSGFRARGQSSGYGSSSEGRGDGRGYDGRNGFPIAPSEFNWN